MTRPARLRPAALVHGIGPALALSIVAHGGAVATIGLLGLGSRQNPPAGAPLFVDLVAPLLATSERTGPALALDPRLQPAPAPRPRPRAADPSPPPDLDAHPPSAAPGPLTAGPPEARPPEAPAPVVLAPPPAPAPPAPRAATAEMPVAGSPGAPPPAEPVRPAPRPAAGPAAPSPVLADRVRESPVRAAPERDGELAGPPASPLALAPVAPEAPARAAAGPSIAPGGRADGAPFGPIDAVAGPAPGAPSGVLPTSAAPPIAALEPAAGSPPMDEPGRGTEAPRISGLSAVGSPDGPAPGPRLAAVPPEYEAYVRGLRQRVQDRLAYPWMAVRRGQQGVVELEVRVGGEGRLLGVEVVAGPTAESLRAAAVAAVRGAAPFPFPPGVEPRPLVIRLPVEFRLR